MSDNNEELTSQGFPKKDLLGDDLNRKTLLAGEITKRLPEYHQFYNDIVDKAAKITYGKYSYFLHLCYGKKLEELRHATDNLLNN